MRRLVLFVICGLFSVMAVGPGDAGPNVDEVKAARALVTDYSAEKRPHSPALSPDGKTVAFVSRGDVWILHAQDLCAGDVPEPWKLGAYGDSLDWSPDGKRLAIATQCLMIAESFDFEAKTAQLRTIAEPIMSDDELSHLRCAAPWWSPDGKKIAFVRERHGVGSLRVIDVGSEKVTTVAEGALAYGQPWSPDGRFLIYTSGTSSETEPRIWTIESGPIMVVSADGKNRSRFGETGRSPSWSPRSDRIAFSDERECVVTDWEGEEQKGTAQVIWVADGTGKNRKQVSSPLLPSEEDVAAVKAINEAAAPEVDKAIREGFEKEFGSELTAEQKKRFESGEMTQDEMKEIAMLLAAREVGGDFEKAIVKLYQTGKLREWDNPEAEKTLRDAWVSVPKDREERFVKRAFRFWADPVFDTLVFTAPASAGSPIWSPDGTRIAYIASRIEPEEASLHVLDLESGRDRMVFTSNYDLDFPGWSADGKLLVVRSTRITKSVSVPDEDGDSTTVSLSPEIWLLQIDP